MLIFKNKVRIW